MIPYGKQSIDSEDVQAVVETLKSKFLTTGPRIAEFEDAVSGYVGARHSVAVSSGTAALHASMNAAGISEGDEVIVPTITFVATANSVVYQRGSPVFVDVDPDTLLIDCNKVEKSITNKTKAIVAVDYAGQSCDYDRLRSIANKYDLVLIADSCHSLGAQYKGRNVGTLADMTIFSFHPVKHITTGEGGMVVTDNDLYVEKMRKFRNHGINTDSNERISRGTWYYEIDDIGYNYRITDFQCALGSSQLQKLPEILKRRRSIAGFYDESFENIDGVRSLKVNNDVNHAYHLYVIEVDRDRCGMNRDDVFSRLREKGVGVNVHYIPIHLHPFYQNRFKTKKGDCPNAEEAYEKILSIPIFPDLKKEEMKYVVNAIGDVVKI